MYTYIILYIDMIYYMYMVHRYRHCERIWVNNLEMKENWWNLLDSMTICDKIFEPLQRNPSFQCWKPSRIKFMDICSVWERTSDFLLLRDVILFFDEEFTNHWDLSFFVWCGPKNGPMVPDFVLSFRSFFFWGQKGPFLGFSSLVI